MNTKLDDSPKRPFTWLWRRSRSALVLVTLVLAFLLGYSFRGDRVPDTYVNKEQPSRTQVWTCPMHPQMRRPGPGLCPICGMELIPGDDSSDDTGSLRQLSISPAAAELMELQTSPVQRRYVETRIRMVGKVEYDETRLAYITAWLNGRLDRLFVDYTGVPVKPGDHMVELYSPELLTAQEELLQSIRVVEELKQSGVEIVRETAQGTVIAAREKLRLWGLAKEQVNAIEARGTATDHVTIYAPIGGIVIHKNAQEGMYVQTGTRIYTIADLTRVWVKFDAYESDLAWLRYGQNIQFTTEAYPGETFTGTISFIDPVLDDRTRTAKVRVNVSNEDGRLKPGMFARGIATAKVARGGRVMEAFLAGKWISPMHPEIVKDGPGACDICGMPLVKAEELGYVSPHEAESAKPLVVPASAVLVTGTRAIVYVKVPNIDKPTFEGREIVLGPRTGDYYIVRSNLKEGELVVTHGNFKIDSALQLSARPSMMTPEWDGGSGGHQHSGQPAPASDDSSTTQPAASMTLPQSFRDQWTHVEREYHNLSKSINEQDDNRVKEAFRAIARALNKIDTQELSGSTRNMWIEMSMRLTNDAVEGEYAKDATSAIVIFDDLTKRIAKVRDHFGLSRVHTHTSTFGVPNEFGRSLEPALTAYFELSSLLARDDFKGASAAVKRLETSIGTAKVSLLPPDAERDWIRSKRNLETSITAIRTAHDIAAAREGFALLSEELVHLVRAFGGGATDSVYHLKCPMAFNNRGGTWIQNTQTVENPYFGQMMLRCGSIIETIHHKNDGDQKRRNDD